MLILAATPIGSAEDASMHLRRVLAEADLIAAEDTRRFKALLLRLGVSSEARVVSFFDGNEAARTTELIEALQGGAQVVVVSDAGMPTVSDPGYRLVRAAIDAGLPITAVPGPSAVLTALALSGLPVDRFCFEGFLSRKAGERRRRLQDLVAEQRTMVFFESPHRIAEMLTDAAQAFGAERAGAVCRELTKTYEEVRRGSLSELADWAAAGVRGEITVVVEGAAPVVADLPTAVGEALSLIEAGTRTKQAVAEIAGRHGMSKNILYDAVLKRRA